MYGFLFYFIALIAFMIAPLSGAWIVLFVIGMLFHLKYWVVGIIAFFVGAGWKNPVE